MKYIVDGKDLQTIANCVRNLNSSSESLTIDTIIAKLKELDDKQSTQRTYRITFNPINCKTTGCHNSGISCSGWDLTEYN
jgi:nitrogenase subunit NifH